MAMSDWGILSPERVSQWINFDRDDQSWHYSAHAPASMQKCQAEGVAALWNTLGRDGLALLADEVGMGKTLQALGVLALLWKQNPDARVLVMAPNRDICTHWAREYHAFLRDHYREVDHLVRNGADGGPVHAPHLCWRLNDLVDAVKAGAGRFYLTTIHSLSGLVPRDEKDTGNVLGKAERAAGRIHKALKGALGDEGFDLIIVDEAHYFRNAHGGSQRAHAARKFFGDADSRLGQKVLLMTATPSHTSLNDIPNVFGFFTEWEEGQEPTPPELLEKHAVRRLRLMQGANTHHNKYHYRHEIALPSSFEDNPEAEMFFALYQKKLVQQQERSGSGRRYLYGYLEGFESVGAVGIEDESSEEEGDDLEAGSSSYNKPEDFRRSEDTSILSDLTRLHFAHFSRYPEHPKYNTLVKLCTPKDVFSPDVELHEHKHLVFVRRIPSVREITQRVNAEYDAILAERIIAAWNPENPEQILAAWRRSGWSRRYYNRFLEQQSGDVLDEELTDWQLDTGDEVEQEKDEKLTSRIADLFVVKKTGSERSTDASNASLRFRKPESLFALFMEPASDYKNGRYSYYYRKRSGERDRDDYGGAALACRLKLHGSYTAKSEGEEGESSPELPFSQALPTAWGMMFDMLAEEHRSQVEAWIARDPGIAENFANYVKAGFLFASPVMVELYSWFVGFNREADSRGDAQSRYHAFCRWVAPRLPDSMMYRYFCAAIETFDQLCEKITDHGLADWQKDWRVLTGLQNPAWYASGESSNRQRLIVGFNSPFYPNVLVATSVFQEGVNLHVQCRKVHHYGIAWTPGDNEQRVGRVDRLFGRVNQELLRNGKGELAIHYPYLARSFDQEQLASFVSLKYGVEARLDACRHANFDGEIDIRQSGADWQQYLRKPDMNAVAEDPYPARFHGASNEALYSPITLKEDFSLREYVHGLVSGALDADSDTIQPVAENEFHPGVVSLVETWVKRGDQTRKQPIVAAIQFSSELSALVSGTVYTLSLQSPLASLATLNSFDYKDFGQLQGLNDKLKAWPLVRLALDDAREKSHFYLHMRVDLPLFVLNDGLCHLSTYEVESAFRQLKEAGDTLEWTLFGVQQDLKKEDLKVYRHAKLNKHAVSVLNEARGGAAADDWKVVENQTGRTALLSVRLNQGMIPHRITHRLPARCDAASLAGCLRLNALLPMVAACPAKNGIEMQVAYPADDFQWDEQALLKRWLGYLSEKGS